MRPFMAPAARAQAPSMKKVAWRVENMTRFVGATDTDMYEDALRILGILSDPTARDAVRNIEREKVAA